VDGQEPEKAPFFLPTLPGLAPVFVPPPPKAKEDAKEDDQPGKEDDVWASAWVSDGDDDHGTQDKVDVKPQSKLLSNSTFHTPRSRLAQLLTAFQENSAESTAVLEYLATLPPSKVDVEVRWLYVD
jgi:Utp21 specific WD40 associated putative domain